MFKPTDSFSEYREYVISKNACQEGVDWMASLPSDLVTCDQVFNYMFESEEVEAGWCAWLLELTGDVIDESLRDIYINKIAQSPRDAAQQYIADPNLTVNQRNTLLRSFHGLLRDDAEHILPTIEEEIKTKKIVPQFRNKGAI